MAKRKVYVLADIPMNLDFRLSCIQSLGYLGIKPTKVGNRNAYSKVDINRAIRIYEKKLAKRWTVSFKNSIAKYKKLKRIIDESK